MKKKFISKRQKHKKLKFKFLLFLLLFILSIYKSFRYLLKSNIKIDNKEFVELLLTNNIEENKITKFIGSINKNYKPVNLLSTNYFELVDTRKKKINTNNNSNSSILPLIYIYNSHQTEEYLPSNFIESEVKPTVMMADYIMEDIFNKNNFNTIVEERSIRQKLNENNWKYYKSYDASRIYLDDTKTNNPSIKYFIDVHRDSLKRDKTTVEINGKSYAKTIFLIGLENDNYNENLEFTTKLNDKLNEKYPNLSKGIYKKGGEGVNGVYNQDNSKYTILLEIGGPENNTTEVLNSTLAFADCFMEVISTNEG